MSQEAWSPECVVSPALAGELVRGQFPELACHDVTLLGEGWDNTVYRIDRRWVFRFPRRQLAVELLQTEALLLPRLAPRLPVAVPRPVWHGRPTQAFPWPFLGHEHLPGTTACSLALAADQRLTLAPSLGRFLAALHTSPVPDGLCADTLGRLDRDRLVPLLRERLATLVERGLLATAGPWLTLLDASADAPGPVARCITHGDLYARHLLLDERAALVGVIDWGDAHRGDPAVDLSLAWSFLPAAARPAFFAAYGAIDERTAALARLRALHSAVAITLYASATGAAGLAREGRTALDHLLS